MSGQGATATRVFLDLDGTLTDPREGIVRCIAHALATLGRPAPPLEDLEGFIGPPLAQSFQSLLGTRDDALVRAAIEAYRARFASVGILENRVYPEVPATLSRLRDQGLVLHLLTSKPRVFACRILDHFALSASFASVHGPELDDLYGTKVVLLREALAREGVDARGAVVVGDRREDVIAARENGARSIGVTWGFGSREELEGAGVDAVVDTPAELASFLDGAGR